MSLHSSFKNQKIKLKNFFAIKITLMNRTLTHLISFGKLFGINHVFQLSGQGNQFAHVIHQLQQKTSQFFASLLTRYLNVIDLESRIGLLEVLLDLVEGAD